MKGLTLIAALGAAAAAAAIPVSYFLLRKYKSWKRNKVKPDSGATRGYHEVELSYTGEAGLQECLVFCDKNPGHTNFVPVKQFTLNHLPERSRDESVLQYILGLSSLTVLLRTTHTSLARPKTFPESTVPYPSYNERGGSCLRSGSGVLLHGFVVYTEEDGKVCPCPSCQTSDEPHKEWLEVTVRTARHVVFDMDEAKHTICKLFFDDSTLKTSSVTLTGVAADCGGSIEDDRCIVTFISHDIGLCEVLEKLYKNCVRYQKQVDIKYRWLSDRERRCNPKQENNSDEDKLVVVISHPHGLSKQISVGQWTHKETIHREFGEETRYQYTAPTCPGSSGAPVYIIGKIRWFSSHPHSRRCVQDGFNESGFGCDLSSRSY